MNRHRPLHAMLALAVLVPAVTVPARAQDPTVPSPEMRDLIAQPGAKANANPQGIVDISLADGDPGRLAEARFVAAPLARVADELGRALKANVVVSKVVTDQRVTITLRGVDLRGALKAIAISQGIVSRYDEGTGIYFLATPDEVRGELSTFLATRTEVFTLLYPNTNDVVRAIGDTFGDRVVVTEDQQFIDQTLTELQNRFRRFDIIDGRGRGLGGARGGTGVQNFQNNQFNNRLNNNLNNGAFNSRFQARTARPQQFRGNQEPTLSKEQARLLAEAGTGSEGAKERAEKLANRRSVTYVAAIQRLNRIIVRSADPEIMEEIRGVIKRLDVPTSLVLLEVRVLRIALSDGQETGLDFAFQSGDAQGAFSRGEIAAPGAASILPGGTGVDLSAGVFQVVSNNFQARLDLLQSKGRVTSLATPILLTANGEVSRIFSGEQVPIVVGFTEPQVIVGEGATTTLSATPVTELRDVGTELLITGNINADRTVTLRLLQETSQVNTDGASILVPSAGSFVSQTIDTVESQSGSGTIVARDGMLLAFGGLIEETETDQRQQIPLLGDLPLIGFLFRRETSVIRRSELVVLVRPYVLSTPLEGDQISRDLLDSLSIHPYRPGKKGATGEPDDWGVFREGKPALDRSVFDLFRFHTAPSFNTNKVGGGGR